MARTPTSVAARRPLSTKSKPRPKKDLYASVQRARKRKAETEAAPYTKAEIEWQRHLKAPGAPCRGRLDLEPRGGNRRGRGGWKDATVKVIDETPSRSQGVVMSCSVPGGKRPALTPGRLGSTAGHYLMLGIDTTSTATTWRVSFRY
jgi:hypothetical protein